MKKLSVIALFILTLGLFACDHDKHPLPAIEMEDYWVMPSMSFGQPLNVVATSEQGRGFQVSASDGKVELTQIIEDVVFNWTYYADADGNYRYAICQLPDGFAGQFRALISSKMGFNERSEYSQNSDYSAYVNGSEATSIVVYSGSTKENENGEYFIYGPYDEDLYSWTRLAFKESTKNTMIPFLGYGAGPELIKAYAGRLGHIVHKNTDESKGFYFYETNDATYPAVAYWLDEETNSKLVEARLYFDSNNLPTTDDITKILNDMGYEYTYSLDPSDDSQIFFDYENKKTIYVAYSAPDDYEGTFLPCIKFTDVDMESNLPPLEVEFPWLPTDVYMISTDDAIKYVESQSWYDSREEDYFGIWPMFKTKIPEFPYVVLLDDEGEYGSGIVFAETTLVLRALSIRKAITETYGCVYKEGSSLYPTFLYNDAEIPWEFQFIYDAGMWGYPALVVEPQ